jgi:hypothetical protein
LLHPVGILLHYETSGWPPSMSYVAPVSNGQRGDISSWAACPRAAHEYQGAGWPDLAGRASRDLKRKQQVLGEASSRLF